jgi:hypothetical protein
MTPEELKYKARCYTDGVISCLARIAMWFIIIGIIVNGFRWVTGFGMDSTDKSGWQRSGLKLHVDNMTGVHYLSDGYGGMTVRLNKDGQPFIEQR